MNAFDATRTLRLERLESRCLLAAFAFTQEDFFDRTDLSRAERRSFNDRAESTEQRSHERRDGSSDRQRSDRIGQHRERQARHRGADHDRHRSNLQRSLAETRRERLGRFETRLPLEFVTPSPLVGVPIPTGLSGQTIRTVVEEISRRIPSEAISDNPSNNRVTQASGEPTTANTPLARLVSRAIDSGTPGVGSTEANSRTPNARQGTPAVSDAVSDSQQNGQVAETRLSSDEPATPGEAAAQSSPDSFHRVEDAFSTDASEEGYTDPFGHAIIFSEGLIVLSHDQPQSLSVPTQQEAAEGNDDETWEIDALSIESLRDIASRHAQTPATEAHSKTDQAIASWFDANSGLIQIDPIGHLRSSHDSLDAMVNVVLEATTGMHRQLDLMGSDSADPDALSHEARDAILATLFAKQPFYPVDAPADPTVVRASGWTYPVAILAGAVATVARRHVKGRGKMLATGKR
ncbi:MAG: hypothetical protein AAGD07_00735 [Planctomycetota bacterium]